jgi:hypothetical protein
MTAILSSLARKASTALPATPDIPVPKAARTAQVYVVFPAQEYGSCQQRYIHNPNATGSFWIAFNGDNPTVNGEDSFEIAPGGRWADAINSEVRIRFTAAAASLTAYER